MGRSASGRTGLRSELATPGRTHAASVNTGKQCQPYEWGGWAQGIPRPRRHSPPCPRARSISKQCRCRSPLPACQCKRSPIAPGSRWARWVDQAPARVRRLIVERAIRARSRDAHAHAPASPRKSNHDDRLGHRARYTPTNHTTYQLVV